MTRRYLSQIHTYMHACIHTYIRSEADIRIHTDKCTQKHKRCIHTHDKTIADDVTIGTTNLG